MLPCSCLIRPVALRHNACAWAPTATLHNPEASQGTYSRSMYSHHSEFSPVAPSVQWGQAASVSLPLVSSPSSTLYTAPPRRLRRASSQLTWFVPRRFLVAAATAAGSANTDLFRPPLCAGAPWGSSARGLFCTLPTELPSALALQSALELPGPATPSESPHDPSGGASRAVA